MKQLLEQANSGYVDNNRMPVFNYTDPSSVTIEDYRVWFTQHGNIITGNFTDCDLEQEMQKVKSKFLRHCHFLK